MDQRIPELKLEKAFYGSYAVSSTVALDSKQLAELSRLVEVCEKRIYMPLSGRAATGSGEIPGLGRVFIKPYRRGGVFRALCKDLYMKSGLTRSEIEFSMLHFVRAIGANAPKPVATLTSGSLIYRTWLVMEEIPGAQSLLEFLHGPEDAVEGILKELAKQLKILIAHRVHHIDFHPGNVVTGQDKKVYVVDFDKARVVKNTEAELRDAYVRRWRRAVIKHRLPPILSERIAFELRCVGYAEP